MRYLLLLCFFTSAFGADDGKPNCLILKHASVSHQVWVSGSNWQYVAGDFPPGEKWRSNVTDRNVRKYKTLGWNVVMVPEKYTPADLDQALKTCRASSPSDTAKSSQ
jgi:hypothetical protein